MTIDLDFEDVDTFAEDVKFKLESSKQAVVKDSNMASLPFQPAALSPAVSQPAALSLGSS